MLSMVNVYDLVSEFRERYGPSVGSQNYSRFFILFSGGRDSFLSSYVVLEALRDESDVEVHVVFVDHFMDFPWMSALAFRALEFFESRYSARVHFVYPSARFWSFVFGKRYLFPVPDKRWHVRHLVIKPLIDFFDKYLDEKSLSTDAVVMGSRYEDSSSKNIKPSGGILNWGVHNITGLHAVFPIAGLSTQQVRDLVNQTPFSVYNDYYPVRGVGKPGFWAYLSDRTLAYHDFAVRSGFPCADKLRSFVIEVSRMQADPSYLGPRRRRWNDFAMSKLFDMVEDLYVYLSDRYAGLYSSKDITYIQALRSDFELYDEEFS